MVDGIGKGILRFVRRILLPVLAFAVALPAIAADPPLVDGVSGAPVVWSDWIARRGPVAVLAWASWSPTANEVLGRHAELSAACRVEDLHLVVLDVQEPLEDGRRALGAGGVAWIHDRHGALLKKYRVIELPSLVIVSKNGEVLARLEPTAEAVRGWRSR